MSIDRRGFLNHAALATAATTLPARWSRGKDLPANRKLKMRFAVASDLRYGQGNTPYEQMAEDMVGWMNKEKESKGLDLLFINGDLTQDKTEMLLSLRDKHLSKLAMPYYCNKGNHDYLSSKKGSLTESWKKIWGYNSNHTVVHKDFAFVLADTSAPAKSNVYLAANPDWLKAEFEKYAKATKTSVLLDSIFANAFSFASGCFKICGENHGRQNHRRQSSRVLSRLNRFGGRRVAVEFSRAVSLDGNP